MKIRCPECGAGYRLDPSKAGSGSALRIRCSKCTNQFIVRTSQNKQSCNSSSSSETAPEVQNFAGGSISRPKDERQEKKILVVDDSPFFRELIADILGPLKVPVLIAGNAEDALAIVEKSKPTVILLDLNMPGRSGYDLIRDIRARYPGEDIRLLAMSAVFRKEVDIQKVIRAGADDFISKSFRPEQLRNRLGELLEKK